MLNRRAWKFLKFGNARNLGEAAIGALHVNAISNVSSKANECDQPGWEHQNGSYIGGNRFLFRIGSFLGPAPLPQFLIAAIVE
ncbi:hypothetical protein FGO68_gene364 [Halteria grandinella]|uniref:Uncharacterized protein n=1 Tax=Halteria grandinella TaxID=5974 RepID=A0A8J8NLE5_HALGN|nr:hypothetical protein FGO68_gene364 [Halteria grandinella]